MKFILIDPIARAIKLRDFDSNTLSRGFHEAIEAIGLTNGELDFAVIDRDPRTGHGLSIAVYEYGLMTPKNPAYFAINRNLYNGSAVLYAFNSVGDTVDIKASQVPSITWLRDIKVAEHAITTGKIDRPITTVNGAITWEWNKEKESDS